MSNVIHILTRRQLDPKSGTTPRPGECLPCFLHRMVAADRCPGTLGWTEHYRSLRAKRAHALVRRLQRDGADCDCAVTKAVWALSPALWVRDQQTGALTEPATAPPCLGVRPGSTQPCDQWAAAKDIAL